MFKALNGSMPIVGHLINSYLGQASLGQPVESSMLDPVAAITQSSSLNGISQPSVTGLL